MKLLSQLSKNSTGLMMFNTASSQMYSNVIRIVGGLITARLVMPDVLGSFNAFALIISYLPILQIGIMNALNRDLPYYIGKGETQKALDEAATTNAWELFLGISSSSVLLIIGIYNLIIGNITNTWGFLTIALSAFFSFYGSNYLQILYRTNSDFNKLARITTIVSTVTFLSIFFVWLWGFEGLCIRQVVSCIVELALLWIWRPLKVKPKFIKAEFVAMVKTGFPIFLVGIVFAYWSTINNTLVLKLGGNEEYGLFSLATIVFSTLSVFSSAITQVLYPKMSQAYGQGANIKEVCKLPNKYVLAISAMLIPTIIALWLLLPPIVNLLLPNYMAGVKAAQWMTLLLLPTLLGVYNNIFNIFKHQLHYLYSIIIGIIVYAISVYVINKLDGYDLSIFPIALFIGRCAQLIVAYFYINKYKKHTSTDALQ